MPHQDVYSTLSAIGITNNQFPDTEPSTINGWMVHALYPAQLPLVEISAWNWSFSSSGTLLWRNLHRSNWRWISCDERPCPLIARNPVLRKALNVWEIDSLRVDGSNSGWSSNLKREMSITSRLTYCSTSDQVNIDRLACRYLTLRTVWNEGRLCRRHPMRKHMVSGHSEVERSELKRQRQGWSMRFGWREPGHRV